MITKIRETNIGEIEYEIECDDCNRSAETYCEESWIAMWAAAKRDGWRATKDAACGWCHTCPDCIDDHENPERQREG